MTKLVKINKCSGKGWWYSEHVGSCFELVRVLNTGNYVVMAGPKNQEGKDVLSCIGASDAELIEAGE